MSVTTPIGPSDVTLTPAQRKASQWVGSSAGPIAHLLLGSSRTGKSTALIHTAATAATAFGSASVLGICSTRLAARDFQIAVARRLRDAVAPSVLTPVALARDLLAEWLAQEGGIRLLTGPEQEVRIREILAGSVGTASVEWPAEWKEALPTRTFARQLRRAVSRARMLDWEPDALEAEARGQDDVVWTAVAQFTREYLEVLDWEGSLDYVELLLRAVRLVESGAVAPAVRPRVLVIDDLHDLDPLALRLVRGVAAPSAGMVAAADPDQSIWSYRGADLSVLREFVAACGAEVVPLADAFDTTAALRDARERLMAGRWYAELPAEAAPRYRSPAVRSERDGAVAIVESRDPGQQADEIARRLRAARRDGWRWTDMAVLAASPAEIPEIVRGLGRSRIPANVPSDDLPLAAQPAVARLLAAARLVGTWDSGALDEPAAASVLAGYAGLSAADMRVVHRWRRSADAEAGDGHGPADRPTSASAAELLRRPPAPDSVPASLRTVTQAVARAAAMLWEAARLERSGASPAEVLWVLWEGGARCRTGWPQGLQRQSLGVGAAAIAANRDLDAVMQMFRLAERAPERWGGHKGLLAFVAEVDAQVVPSEPDLAQESHRDQVQVMSLQRAKARVWPIVIVTGVHERGWSAGGSGGGLFQVERLTTAGLNEPPGRTTPGESRRVLSFALSRATFSSTLMSCGGEESPLLPMLADMRLPVRTAGEAPSRPHTFVDLLTELRATATGPDVDAARGAAARLALLARATDRDGGAAFPGADPAHWPGVSEWTVAPAPLRDSNRSLSLSASAVSAVAECPLRWFLGREARARRPMSAAAGFGLVVHQAIARVIEERNADRPSPTPTEALSGWTGDDYDASWHAQRERDLAEAAVDRATQWLALRAGGIDSELAIDVLVTVPDESGEALDRVRVRGSVDALEHTDQGAVVWDFKTRRSRPSSSEGADNVQLQTYQLAMATLLVPAGDVAGAGLVHVCLPTGKRDPLPLVLGQPAQDLSPTGPVHSLLRSVVTSIRTEEFGPRPSAACRTCDFRASCPARGAAS